MRIEEIRALLKRHVPGATVVKAKHEEAGNVELVLLEAAMGNYRIVIREVWVRGRLKRYGYQLLRGGSSILRYNNAPHHHDVPTFPHHKHIGSRVEPLEKPNLETFLEEARRYCRKKCRWS